MCLKRWLDCYKAQHSILFDNISGEVKNVDLNEVNEQDEDTEIIAESNENC